MLFDGQTWLEQALVGSADASPAVRAKARDGAGVMAMELGQFAASRLYHEDALRLYEALGDQPHIADTLESLGLLTIHEHDSAAAAIYLERGLALQQDANDALQWSIGQNSSREILVCLETLAAMAVETGGAEDAARLYGAAETLFQTTGILVPSSLAAERPRRIARARDLLGEADWQATWEIGRQTPPTAFLAEAVG